MTVGSLLDLWRSSLAAGRLAPAWAVVASPDQYDALVGSLAEVLDLSAADIIAVEPASGKRTLSRALVANWINQAQLAPRGRYQLAVLRSAEMMPAVVANILLKTLEEPPAGTIFLILMSRDALLPTIRSRVQLATLAEESVAVDKLPPADLSAMLKWASGAAEQNAWPETVKQIGQSVRRALREGRLTGEEADRALALMTTTTAGLNRKLQLASLMAKLQS